MACMMSAHRTTKLIGVKVFSRAYCSTVTLASMENLSLYIMTGADGSTYVVRDYIE